MQCVSNDIKILSYVAVADDATANTVAIATGLGWVGAAVVQITRSGAVVTADAVITLNATAGSVTVADGGATYAITAGDVISIAAVGKP
jgi:hypothetical protein